MSDQLFTPAQQSQLLTLARESIQHGLHHGGALAVEVEDYDPTIGAPGAAFVTLEKGGQLRGCIGSIEAYRPLVEDVALNAWNAAFRDPRFNALSPSEYEELQIEISILTQPEDMVVESEEDLMQQLVPGKDGLILSDDYHRGLFLPAVWEKLPDVKSFLSHLKQKAGLPQHHWSDTMRCQRFYSFEFCETDDQHSPVK